MSRFEGVPISILEARQHGLPLVLTDIPGHRDGAGTSPAAFVPVDDTEAFADEALALLTVDHPHGMHQPDTGQLTREWDSYRDGFLSIVAAACGSLHARSQQQNATHA